MLRSWGLKHMSAIRYDLQNIESLRHPNLILVRSRLLEIRTLLVQDFYQAGSGQRMGLET